MNPISDDTMVSLDVLIVDDDPGSLLLVSAMVDYVGHRSVTAEDYAAAVIALNAGPAAVVLDLIMPDASSERFIQEIAAVAPDTPVVLISAVSEEVLAERALECRNIGVNVVATLQKPFWVEALVSAMEKAIPACRDQFIAPG
jgi:DNA-binding NtrC family response regulator